MPRESDKPPYLGAAQTISDSRRGSARAPGTNDA